LSDVISDTLQRTISVVDAAETQSEIEQGRPVKYKPMPRGVATASGGQAVSTERAADRSRSEQTRAKLVMLIDKLPGGTLADFDASLYSKRHRRARKKKPTWRS
jgi:hypothetical protein